MTNTKLRLLAVVGLALGLLGGAGAGVYFATAAEPPGPVVRAAEPVPGPVQNPAVPADPARPEARAEAAADGPAPGVAALLKPFGKEVPPEGVKLEELFERIENQTGLVLRVDVAAFRRIRALGGDDGGGNWQPQQLLRTIYETNVILPRRAEKLPIRDVLADALAQVGVTHPCTYQVREGQLLIVPAYTPPVRPGANPLDLGGLEDDTTVVPLTLLYEQIHGGVVSVATERKPLTEILADLRKQTGANIVLDPRCEGPEKKVLSVTLNDVRLYDALRVIADMAELKMVYAGNIYYVTTPANAKSFQPATPRPPVPSGPLGGPMLGGPAPGK
jgi:hypothetical protein